MMEGQKDEGRKIRKVEDSEVEQMHILFPRDLNDQGRLYGGQLLEWLDEIAGIVAQRHCGGQVVTASIDHMDFKAGAKQGDMIYIHASLTYVGNTSMEVRIDSYVESLEDGIRRLINRAYFVMVAVDENGKPVPVPALEVEGIGRQAEWEAARRRRELRTQRIREGF